MLDNLVRNTSADGVCKYAILRLDRMPTEMRDEIVTWHDKYQKFKDNPAALIPTVLIPVNFVEVGRKGDPEESFTIKLHDPFSTPALLAYAEAAREYGMTGLADAVEAMAVERSGAQHPNHKIPD